MIKLDKIIMLLIIIFIVSSCNESENENYDKLFAYWGVTNIENRSSTGDYSTPWLKINSTELITFVYYAPVTRGPELRECTMRSGQITSITNDIIVFTEDYSGSSKSVSYSFSGADLKLIWDDGEIYTMTTVTGLPYPEDDAVSSPCFN